jgi:hypothetical protein
MRRRGIGIQGQGFSASIDALLSQRRPFAFVPGEIGQVKTRAAKLPGSLRVLRLGFVLALFLLKFLAGLSCPVCLLRPKAMAARQKQEGNEKAMGDWPAPPRRFQGR